jgi:adiponectin receptor
MGSSCIVISLWDKFSTPEFRVFRAAMFTALGSSSLIPAIHFVINNGWYKVFAVGAFFWFLLTGALYALGAYLYAARIPEKWYIFLLFFFF